MSTCQDAGHSQFLYAMATRSARPFPDPPPADAGEFAGRVVLAAALAAMFFGFTAPWLEATGKDGTASLEWSTLLRIGTFALGALAAGLVQGARPKSWVLVTCGLLAGWAALALRPGTGSFPLEGSLPPHTGPFTTPAWELGRLETSLLAAVLLGTWLARGLEQPAQLLAVVLCAAAGDAWLSVLRVPESVSAGHPARLMRLAWPPPVGDLGGAPSFADLVFLALYLEAGRRFRFNLVSIFCGAFVAYAVASMLALTPWRVTLSLPVVGLGVLMGAWSDFRCSLQDVLKAFALALLLFALLLGLTTLRGAIHPQPQPRPDPLQYRNVARAPREDAHAYHA